MENPEFKKERRTLGGKTVEVRLLAKPFMLTEKEKRKVSRKVTQRINYWKKHDRQKYKEAMRAIKMAEGKIV